MYLEAQEQQQVEGQGVGLGECHSHFFSLIFFRVQEPAGSRVGERPLGVPDFTDSAAFTHLWTPVLQKW